MATPFDVLYEKLFNTLLYLRDAREHFRTYSAQDIKKLIQAKMTAKTLKEPKGLGELYMLEKQIRELREATDLEKAKSNEQWDDQ